jgi:hypothetical protein
VNRVRRGGGPSSRGASTSSRIRFTKHLVFALAACAGACVTDDVELEPEPAFTEDELAEMRRHITCTP